ncbi:phage major capsid protein [Nocardia huaxiensis]|uniref:Phage major capsid protein n=1 Tax=Nocardia huaxiensis TaxID=2755382 RepID=A0A7D6V6P3_9NOCA|nr:phage major capsid protein [Nocardia huaxiensis]QLY27974.1 phage major capsid protein [Nocardia huaxiensis]
MTATTSNTKALLHEQVVNVLVQPLEAESVVLASGPQIKDSSEPVRFPRLVSGPTVGFVGEGEQIPSGDVKFDDVKMMPSDRKSLKIITKFTNEMVRQSVLGLNAALKARLVKSVADTLDTAFLIGDGADKSITGIINQAEVQKMKLDLTSPDCFIDAVALANSKEVKNPNRWFISGADFATISKLKDKQDRYLMEQDLTKDSTPRLRGIPVTVTNKLPAGKAVLADMTQVMVVRDLAPSVVVLDELYAETDETGIRVVTRYDLGLLHPEGIVVLDKDFKAGTK